MRRVDENRSLISFILLTIVTCGIYLYYWIYKLSQDMNTVCEGDGEHTTEILPFIGLCIITCGIYAWFYLYSVGNRQQKNAQRYGVMINENGTTVLMWAIFGVLLCGIGTFWAYNIIIKNMNLLAHSYNVRNGFSSDNNFGGQNYNNPNNGYNNPNNGYNNPNNGYNNPNNGYNNPNNGYNNPNNGYNNPNNGYNNQNPNA